MKQESPGVNHGGGIMEENHKAATVGNLGRSGNVSGKHLGGIHILRLICLVGDGFCSGEGVQC